MSSSVGTACSTPALATATTIMSFPITISLAVQSALLYVSAIVAKAVSKAMSLKRAKLMVIAGLAKSGFFTLFKCVGKVIDDGKI